MKSTIISLQLVDQSIKYPKGIVEDVLVKVDKFIFHVDFIVFDMKVDQEVPLTLGRTFLTLGRSLINVHNGQLTLRINDQEVTFNMFDAMKYLFEEVDYVTNVVDNVVDKKDKHYESKDLLEVYLV